MDRPHLDPNTKLLTEEYAEGVGEFMRLVHQQPEANTGMLRCLCSSCNNNRILKEWDVRTHLYMRGFTQNYKVWCLHGENGYEYGSTSEPQHVESIFVCSIRMSLVPCRLSSLFSNPAESILHPYPQGYTTWFNKSKNGISRCINKMMYFMLRKGYPTYSVIPNDECHLWFLAVPKKKGRLVGLARRASSCPSSSQAPFAPPDPTIIEQLQNKDDRMVALETQNATILAELVGQKKTNEEIMEKMKRLFPNDF
ncbi:hypothetical protein F2Q70_00026350 [Brassica cretica]|uniref:Transposase-associated domain-containing protein n=1 Tax=Brassica cretica TaxID=69181 RepID=A0A8S9L1N7_BRACR|nr:hypothetical protein F2Q70_00026350 [Brassica cretica]